MDPVTGNDSSVLVGGTPGYVNSGRARVAATNAKPAFVALTAEAGQANACSTCLAQLDLSVSPPTIQPAPQPQAAHLTGLPLVQSSAAGDRAFLSFGAAPGGPFALWTSSAPNQLSTATANASALTSGPPTMGISFLSSLLARHNSEPRIYPWWLFLKMLNCFKSLHGRWFLGLSSILQGHLFTSLT